MFHIVLKIKKIIYVVLRWFFSVIPVELVKRIIIIIPRLSVSAPPGISFLLSNYLGEFNIDVDTIYTVEKRMLTGIYEKGTSKIIEKFVNEGDVCFDIGANVGPITLELAQKVKPKGKVYAFEPGPPIFERLVRNITLNPPYTSAIISENLGVSEQNGKLFWSEGTEEFDQRGNGSLRVGPDYRNIKVDVVSLDSYCQSKGIKDIDFIKIVTAGNIKLILNTSNIVAKTKSIKNIIESLLFCLVKIEYILDIKFILILACFTN